MASVDGDVLDGIVGSFASGTVAGGIGAAVDGDVLDGIINKFASGTVGGRIGRSVDGDVLCLCASGGSMIPTGVAVFAITKLSVTIYRLVYEIVAIVVGGGADGSTTISNATLLADSFGNGPLKDFILLPTYASSALALKGSASGNGETNIYGAAGSSAIWSINAVIDGAGKITLVPAIYTLNDGAYTAITEIIFRHSIVV